MKHTNTLLKILDSDGKEEERTKDSNIGILTSKLRIVHELTQSAGWTLFIEELKYERRKLFAMLERSTDPTTLSKVTGTLLAVESFVDWPATIATELEAQINDMKKND
jgi:hypothetical protein